jgi:Eco57I restriction-modification methylase
MFAWTFAPNGVTKGRRMSFNTENVRALLLKFGFAKLFIDELGWDRHKAELPISIAEMSFVLKAVAEKRGMVVWACRPAQAQPIPDRATRKLIERQVAKTTLENLIIFTDDNRQEQVWSWSRHEPGKPNSFLEHFWYAASANRGFVQKLEAITFSFSEEESLTLIDVTTRARTAFDVERVTKRFYDQFKVEHNVFLDFIDGITDLADREWYASLMLNRLMFIYFMQRKGFLNGERNYLRDRLARCQRDKGQDKFYSFYRYFLLRLFHEGLGSQSRKPELDKLLGRIPYLNGGLFEMHPIEERCPKIKISDEAFTRIFAYFDRYQWHLDERPLRNQDEINPDVLGYIFEKYVNQKQLGAYYTKEDITEYISKSTVIPFLFDATKVKCKVAFENPGGPTIWDHLRHDPDRYIHLAVKHGVENQLPAHIAAGIADVSARTEWNRAAPNEFGLPAESWREVVARRVRYNITRTKLAAGEVREISDVITLNLDIRQFAQDVIERCEGPDLLRSFWKAIEGVTVLDPTCGSGAFLFAALNILEPIYETCLSRMEAFVADLERSREDHGPKKFEDFKMILSKVGGHPNARYFILKSIILNNLFGVDIMEEAVEICKLRLFLKLAAQVDPDMGHENLGIEPLPDIDFNIRAGNTLVGYATLDELKTASTSKLDLDNSLERIARSAANLQQTFDLFRQRQVEADGSISLRDKQELRAQLKALGHDLNGYLARDYGINVNSRNFAKWLKSHQPFHWFIEFHGIMNAGGFDVIIGNPPFVEYSKVRARYTVAPQVYSTLPCGNLYTLVLERSYLLGRNDGWVSLIVPLSIVSTSRTDAVRALVKTFPTWLSCYDMRPGSLFEGVAQRLTIIISQNQKRPSSNIFVGGYRRWVAEERPFLIALTTYSSMPVAQGSGPIAKFASAIEQKILSKIAGPSLELSAVRNAPSIVVHRIVRYFVKALNFVPFFVDAHGSRGKSDDYKEFRFDPEHRDVVTAILNSNLFYWFWRSHSDGFHCGYNDVYSMPYKRIMDADRRKSLGRLLQRLMKQLVDISEKRTIKTKAGQIRYQEFYPAKSKEILDEIDRALAPHFEFTAEELDFVINYDIKYRLGREAESDEE